MPKNCVPAQNRLVGNGVFILPSDTVSTFVYISNISF